MRSAWCNSAKAAPLLAAVVAATVWAGPAGASEIAWSPESVRSVARPEGLRVLSGTEGFLESAAGAAGQVIDALERSGYHVDVAVLPGTFFVRPMPGAGALPEGLLDVTPAVSEPAPPAGSGVGENPFPNGTDLLLPSLTADSSSGTARSSSEAPSLRLPDGLPYGARWRDTSEFMIGKVAVPILFPESDGTVDPSHYDWTPALRDSVVRAAVRGLLRWTSLADGRGIPLTFIVEVHAASPTRYEPIDRPVADALAWIEDLLEPLVGYRGDAVAMAYDVANGSRARLGAHWAALLIAVQNSGDPQPGFPDGIGEYAQLGGPYFVILAQPSNSAGGGSVDFYVEHEMAHMFWALDEYPANNAWWSCTYRSGYFNQPNSNSDVPSPGYCHLSERCLMKGNYPDSLCLPTARQIGWADLDQSGIPDLYETRPDVRPDSSSYGGPGGQSITIHGGAADIALPNMNSWAFDPGDSITIATLDSLWYRLDGGAWTPMAADDGKLDQGAERFTLVLGPLAVGNHGLEFQALNSNGRMLAKAESIAVVISGGSSSEGPGGAGSAPRVRLRVGPSPGPGPIRFALLGSAGSAGTARLFDVSGREVTSWRVDIPSSGVAAWEWDGARLDGGSEAGGIYFLEVVTGRERLTRRVVLLR